MNNEERCFEEGEKNEEKSNKTWKNENKKRMGRFVGLGRKENIEKKKKQRQKDEDEEYKIKEAKSQQVRWTKNEDEIYIKFIRENSDLFNTENLRRTGRVFMRMSKEMKGLRTPNQCKSHHQKMQKVTQSGDLKEIINYLEVKYSLSPAKETKTKDIEEKEKSLFEEFEENGYQVKIGNVYKGIEILVSLSELKMGSW